MRKIAVALFILAVGFQSQSCKKKDVAQDTPFEVLFSFNDASRSTAYDSIPEYSTGYLTVEEASGGAPCSFWPGFHWLINDSGNDPSLFLINGSTGRTVLELQLDTLDNTDWEDLASYTDSTGTEWLYIADIGDNLGIRSKVQIHKFKAPLLPEIDTLQSPYAYTPQSLTTQTFVYPAGARDAESLFIDPLDGTPYVISKRESMNKLFRLPATQIGQIDTLEYIGKWSFTGSTGADSRMIGPDQYPIVIRTYDKLMYWDRAGHESIYDALNKPPTILPYTYIEFQGEAIWLDQQGNFSTCSEKVNSFRGRIYTYNRK